MLDFIMSTSAIIKLISGPVNWSSLSSSNIVFNFNICVYVDLFHFSSILFLCVTFTWMPVSLFSTLSHPRPNIFPVVCVRSSRLIDLISPEFTRTWIAWTMIWPAHIPFDSRILPKCRKIWMRWTRCWNHQFDFAVSLNGFNGSNQQKKIRLNIFKPYPSMLHGMWLSVHSFY